MRSSLLLPFVFVVVGCASGEGGGQTPSDAPRAGPRSGPRTIESSRAIFARSWLFGSWPSVPLRWISTK